MATEATLAHTPTHGPTAVLLPVRSTPGNPFQQAFTAKVVSAASSNCRSTTVTPQFPLAPWLHLGYPT
eukprot:3895258-Rhodomonas_salina.2